MLKKYFFFFIFLVVSVLPLSAQTSLSNYAVATNIPYRSAAEMAKNPYMAERCKLDIYYPRNTKHFSTVIWFHGGGLTGGNKEIPEQLQNKDLCVVGVGYRLAPNVSVSDCIDDAAAAVAWVFRNIGTYQGDTTKIFVSGHSAGGYLAAMIGLDVSRLKKYNVDANKIAGLIPFSGQMITHFTERKSRGIPETVAVIDSLAPLHYVRADAPPLLLITGDRELELLGRYEENAYMARMMRIVGHKQTRLYELQGFDHMMTVPAFPLLVKEVKRIESNNKK